MKVGSLKRTFILFSILLSTALLFVTSSILLIASVNENRQEVERLVNQITLLGELEENSESCISNLDQNRQAAFNEVFDCLVSTDYDLDLNPELTQLSDGIAQLKLSPITASDFSVNQTVKDELNSLIDLAKLAKTDRRQALGVISAELGKKWNYTHILIIAACVLAFIMAIVGFGIYRSQRKLNQMTERNSLFMRSLVDCVIICDNKGYIVEYNSAMSELFGFDNTEAIGMNIRELYALESESREVEREIKSQNSFKGEVVNRRKD